MADYSGKLSYREKRLRAKEETIYRRMTEDVKTEDQRPSLTEANSLKKEIAQTLKERRPLYEGSMSFAVDTDDIAIEDICKSILIEMDRNGINF